MSSPRRFARASVLAFGLTACGIAQSAPLSLGLRTTTGFDSVDHAPNVGGGRLASPERRQRYVDMTLEVGWSPAPRLSLHGSLSRRRITLLRDAHEIDGWSVGAGFDLLPDATRPDARVGLRLSVGVAGNVDARLEKNSWTRIDAAVLTETQLLDARDTTLHADLVGTLRIGPRTSIVALAGGGRVRTEHAAVEGRGHDAGGCAHRFSFSGGGGRLEQIGPCGSTLSFGQSYPDERAIEERFGLAPSRDLAWDAVHWRLGAALRHERGRLGLEVGARYRRRLDDDLSRALRAGGTGSIAVTRTAWVATSWRASPSLRLATAVTWRTAPLLNEVPVLYSALSADRYHTNAVTFAFGLELLVGGRATATPMGSRPSPHRR